MRLLSFLLGLVVCGSAWAQTAPAWQRAAPEDEGMDSRALAALVEYGSAQRMDSLVVVRNGRIVTEAYYAPFKAGMKHRVNSVTKGVVAALAGIASGQGLLGPVDAPVLELFAGRQVANTDDRKKAVTLQHLLDMTSGLAWTEPLDGLPESVFAMERSADWQQYVLDQPMARPPGTAFNYSSGGSHLVSAVVARKTGMNTADYAARELFGPLGITDWQWRRDPQGVAIGGYGLYLTTTDMARIGLLYLQDGRWQDRQLVPAAWVGKVWRASVPMPGMNGAWRYGDFWWTLPSRKAYMAVGYLGQVIMVLPQSAVVVAMTGSAHNQRLDLMIDHIERAVRGQQPLPPDAEGFALLQRRVQEAANGQTFAVPPASPLAAQISGRTWRMAPNPLGVREITLDLAGAASLRVVTSAAPGSAATRTLVAPMGLAGVPAIGDAGAEGIVATRAHWADERTLAVFQHWPQEARALAYELRFDGRRLELAYSGPFGRGILRGETGD